MSDHVKETLRLANTGKKMSEEQKAKISGALKGRMPLVNLRRMAGRK